MSILSDISSPIIKSIQSWKFLGITGILACDLNGAIAFMGKMPWYNFQELKYFRDITAHSKLIMGKKTYYAIPRYIANRQQNIILSRSKITQYPPSTSVTFAHITQLPLIVNNQLEHYFFIGGAKSLIPMLQHNILNRLLLTILQNEYEADTYINIAQICNSFSTQKTVFSSKSFQILYLQK